MPLTRIVLGLAALALTASVATAQDKDKKPRLGLGSATDIASALQLAYGLYPAGYLRRAVVLTDGVQTDGDLLAEANRAREFGVKVFTVPSRLRASPSVIPTPARGGWLKTALGMQL